MPLSDRSKASGASSNMPTIMIIEDEPMVGFFLIDVLEARGWLTLGPFMDNQSAIACLEQHRPEVALVCLNLTDEDSEKTIARLNQLKIPFIIVSGYDYDEAIAASNQCAAWLTKPVQGSHLVETVTLLLAGECARETSENFGDQKTRLGSVDPEANEEPGR
jgi:DNA-binding response OmpR family regulator